MTRRVVVGAAVLEKAHDEFGEDRTVEGSPSEYDFVSGPLAAALFVFRDFENLSFDLVPAVRSYTIVDPFFGPVVFVGVLTVDDLVEIVDFAHDRTTGSCSTNRTTRERRSHRTRILHA